MLMWFALWIDEEAARELVGLVECIVKDIENLRDEFASLKEKVSRPLEYNEAEELSKRVGSLVTEAMFILNDIDSLSYYLVNPDKLVERVKYYGKFC